MQQIIAAPATRRGRVTRRLALAVIVALPVLLTLPALRDPIFVDEAIFATIARGMLDGQLLYRDLFDDKPPAIFAWYALNFLLFGESIEPVRLSIAVAMATTTLLMFLLIRRLYSDAAAYLGATVFAISTGFRLLIVDGDTEQLMLLPMVGSLLAFVIAIQDGRSRLLLLAGALGAVAALTKQVAVFNLIALGMMALAWGGREAASFGRLRPALYLTAGAAAVLALALVPFVTTGTLGDAVDANIQFNVAYGSLASGMERAAVVIFAPSLLAVASPPLVIGALLGLGTLLRRRRWPADHLIAAWAVASAAGIASAGVFFAHYLIQILPAVALLTAAYFEAQRTKFAHSPRRAAVASTAGALMAVSLVLALTPASYRPPATHHQSDEWRSEIREIGAYLSARSQTDETIYVRGLAPQVYFYADRRPAARYFFDVPLYVRSAAMDETARTLRTHPPQFIIDAPAARLSKYARGPDGVAELIRDEYELVEDTGLARIYRWRQAP